MHRFLTTLLTFYLTAIASSVVAEKLSVLNEQSDQNSAANQTERVTRSVDRALSWLADQQFADGNFSGPKVGQPGITSLSVMAFLSAGHLPGEGPYGRHLEQAIKYTLGCEIQAGLFCASKPGSTWEFNGPSHTATYNQAVTALMLAEVSGELTGSLGREVTSAVERALEFTLESQVRNLPHRPQDEGGWRYIVPFPDDGSISDLSVTAWQVSFLRSAKNAGFDVKDESVVAARKYVKGLFSENYRTFTYNHSHRSRSMTGAGVMAMAMLGQVHTDETSADAETLQRYPFKRYGEKVGTIDRFHYSIYYCTQAMYQLGGQQWDDFCPEIVGLLIDNQSSDGSWSATGFERTFGDTYATAMSVLSLTPPYAMLPIHQR